MRILPKAFLLCGVFLAGAILMHWWDRAQLRRDQAFLASAEEDFFPLEETTQPEMDSAVADLFVPPVAAQASAPKEPSGETMPVSQIAQLKVSNVRAIIPPVETQQQRENISIGQPEQPARPHPTQAQIEQFLAQLKARTAQVESESSSSESMLSLLDIPVRTKVITSLEQYRAFKRTARGLYPTANFKTQQVLVLESAGNFPDNVFEIVNVKEAEGKRVVSYSVNILGAEGKTNTHSAVIIKKDNLPLELKQVL